MTTKTFFVAIVTDDDHTTWPTDEDSFTLQLDDVPDNKTVTNFKELVQAKAKPDLDHMNYRHLDVYTKEQPLVKLGVRTLMKDVQGVELYVKGTQQQPPATGKTVDEHPMHLTNNAAAQEEQQPCTTVATPPSTPRAILGWELKCTVAEGARCRPLRRKTFRAVEETFGYDAVIKYDIPTPETPITRDVGLSIIVYYEKKEHAMMMRNKIFEYVDSVGLQRPLELAPQPVVHSFKRATVATDYIKDDSPNRKDWNDVLDDPISVATSVLNSKLSGEAVENETIVRFGSVFVDGGVKPEWAHVKSKKRIRDEVPTFSGVDEVQDEANRLVLPGDLHALFDGQGSSNKVDLNIRADDPSEDGRVRLFVMFRTKALANQHAHKLKDSVAQDDGSYAVFVKKANVAVARRFVKYVNERHNFVMKEWEGYE